MWAGSGRGVAFLVQAVTLIILVRFLSPAEYGMADLVLVAIGLSTIFADMGAGPTLVQLKRVDPGHNSAGLITGCSLGIILSLSLWIFAPQMAQFFGSIAEPVTFTAMLRVGCAAYIITPFAVPAEAKLRRTMKFRAIAAVEVASLFTGVGVISVVLAVNEFGAWSVVVGQITYLCVRTALINIVDWPQYGMPARKHMRDVLWFGWGHSLGRLGNYSAGQGDNIVAGGVLGAASLGAYARAYKLMAVPAQLIGQVINQVLFAAFSRRQDEVALLNASYGTSVRLLVMMFAPMSALLILVGEDLVVGLLGSEWAAAALPFQILAAGTVFRAGYKISDSVVNAVGAVYRRAWRQWAFALCVLAFGWVGARYAGLPGLASGVVVALAVNYCMMASLALSVVGGRWVEWLSWHTCSLLPTAIVGLTTLSVNSIVLGSSAIPPLVRVAACFTAAVMVSGLLFKFLPQRWWLPDDIVVLIDKVRKRRQKPQGSAAIMGAP